MAEEWVKTPAPSFTTKVFQPVAFHVEQGDSRRVASGVVEIGGRIGERPRAVVPEELVRFRRVVPGGVAVGDQHVEVAVPVDVPERRVPCPVRRAGDLRGRVDVRPAHVAEEQDVAGGPGAHGQEGVDVSVAVEVAELDVADLRGNRRHGSGHLREQSRAEPAEEPVREEQVEPSVAVRVAEGEAPRREAAESR
jgi:hypothetical protein